MQYNRYGSKLYRVVKTNGATTDSIYHDLAGTYRFDRVAPSRKKPSGWLSPTSFSLSTNSPNAICFDYFYARATAKSTGNRITVIGNEKYGVSVSNLSFDNGLASRAELKALQKLKDQHVNLSVAFAERAATAETVAQTATMLARAINRIRKFDVPGTLAALGADNFTGLTKKQRRILSSSLPNTEKASNLWLSLQYGWLPLLSDVYGSAEQLAQHDAAYPDRYRASVRGKAGSTQKNDFYKVGQFACSGGMRFNLMRSNDNEMSAYVRLDFKVGNPVLAEASQVGFTNPVSVAWELVPFSFVADWFYPIGNYINALDATLGWDFMGGSLTKRIEQKTRNYPQNDAGYNGNYYNGTVMSGYGTYYRKSVTRSVYSAPPIPDLIRPKVPDFGGRRASNAIALLKQAFR